MSLQQKQLQHMEKMQKLAAAKKRTARDVDLSSITTSSRGAAAAATSTSESEPQPKKRGRPSKQSVLSKHMKTLIDYLKDSEKPSTFNDLVKQTQVDINCDDKNLKTLFGDLRKNPKVQFIWDSTKNPVDQQEDEIILMMSQGTFEYKPTHQVKNIEDIITLLRDPENRSTGVDSKELKDAYKNVETDIEELITSGRIYSVRNVERKSNILYYKDPALFFIVDQKLKDLWNTQVTEKIPISAHDLELHLKKSKLKPLETYDLPTELKRKAEEEAERRGQKKQRKSTIRKYTNAHIMDKIETINAAKQQKNGQ